MWRRKRTTARPTYAFDDGPRRSTGVCDCCATPHTVSRGLVLRDDQAFAAYWFTWYPDHGEGWLDASLGSWDEPDFADHVTFGCRIGAVDGQAAPACSLVSPQRADGPVFVGRLLDPDEARAHPWLTGYWGLVDWVVENDPLAHEHVFHAEPAG